jgi:hypothetical protein
LSVVTPPRPRAIDTFSSVWCVSATACTAAGNYYTSSGRSRTLIESWNGTSWSIVPSPSRASGSSLDGVSCVSATVCTAVGSYINTSGASRTLIESETASG